MPPTSPPSTASLTSPRTLRPNTAPRVLRVNAVDPGYIETPLLAAAPEELLSGLAAKHPLGRLGQPEEFGNVTMFLLSDKANFMTGSYVLVDGDYTAV